MVNVWTPDRMTWKRDGSKRLYELQKEIEEITRDSYRREENQRIAYFDRIEREFVLRPEHITLLKEGHWILAEGTDAACVAMSGKWPFGNGDWIEDIWRILDWPVTYGPEGAEDEWINKARDIMAELPYAVKAILDRVDIDTIVAQTEVEPE